MNWKDSSAALCAYLMERVVVMDSGCWEWQAYVDENGYGKLAIGRKTITASKFSYIVFNQHWPSKGVDVDHICRNRQCVNPEHLRLLTRGENVLAGEGLCANFKRATHCVNGHLFSEENIWTPKGTTYRYCRTCRRERNRISNYRAYWRDKNESRASD